MSNPTKPSRPRTFLSDPRSTRSPAPIRPVSNAGQGLAGLRDPRSTR